MIPHYRIHISHFGQSEGQTIYSLLSTDNHFFVPDEINGRLKHSKADLLSTCNEGPDRNTSNFFITLGGDLSQNDGKCTIFGEVSENFELILKIAGESVDQSNRPLRNIRIVKTEILYDPFDDPPGFSSLKTRFAPFPRVPEVERIEDDEELPAPIQRRIMNVLKN
jgi:hypothetical protein